MFFSRYHDEQLTASPVRLWSSPVRGLHCFNQRGPEDRVTRIYLFTKLWGKCYKKEGGLEATEGPPFTRLTQQNAGNLFGEPNTTSSKIKSNRTDKRNTDSRKSNEDSSADEIRNY